ncbi:hypothetical protein J1N35_015431 [Gossypium stocksii]|uniref:SWIM-type domain-containing protein n=1 Tax=Gossypium stocksii TaxID=47602 RepID=A0A9D4A9V3_9ROSI|nr:hypothetical protein J1N35_015431 [Gossypium stocksii]
MDHHPGSRIVLQLKVPVDVTLQSETIKRDNDLEQVIDSHCSSGNIVLELYADFVEKEKYGLSSRTPYPPNPTPDEKAESPPTRLYGRMISLLQSLYQDPLESSSMVRVRARPTSIPCNVGETIGRKLTGPERGVIGVAYRIDLRQMTCDYGRFQALCYPCTHPIVACASERIDCMTYVDEVYRLEQAYNVWKSEFPPIPSESMWSPTSHVPFELVLDKNSHHKSKSRLNSTHF